MRNFVLPIAAALLISPAFADAVFAEPAPGPKEKAQTAPDDPNEIVCEKQQQIGSRLVNHRICMTRGQWAEEHRIQRMDLEHIQTQRGCSDKC